MRLYRSSIWIGITDLQSCAISVAGVAVAPKKAKIERVELSSLDGCRYACSPLSRPDAMVDGSLPQASSI
jgi:hypothetical protein